MEEENLDQEQEPSRLLALALLGLGSTGLGALMGGRDGAMLGAQQGAQAGASVFTADAKREDEQRKQEAADEKREQQKEEDFEEFQRREDYKAGKKIEVKETPPGKAPATPKPAAGPKPPDAIKGEDKLRNEWIKHPTTARTEKIRAAYNSLAASRADAAGDLSLIFQYMKMLDPTSTVREGEQASAQNAAGVDDQIRNMYNRIVSGERLSEDQRAQFKGQAKALLDAQESEQTKVDDYYSGLAKQRSLNPGNVVRKAPAAAAPSADKPGPGSIVEVDGKRYRVGADGDTLEDL